MPMARTPTELRKDPMTDRWVFIRKPKPIPSPIGNGTCAFCPGHESRTPPEIAAYRVNGHAPNSSGWLIRVIPERLPLLQVEGDVQREGVGMYDWVSGRGASEIVVETPDHHGRWDCMPVEDVQRVLAMYRDRMEDLYRDGQIRILLIVRQEPTPGAAAGHPVSRILGSPVLFDDIRSELTASRSHFARKKRCLLCDVLHQERRDGCRVIEETDHFLVYAPYASPRPFAAIVIPTVHADRFERIAPAGLADLAATLQRTTRRFRRAVPGRPLALTLHSAPNGILQGWDEAWQTLAEAFHWHVEIAPDDPVESVGGVTVNQVPPEEAARRLREVS